MIKRGTAVNFMLEEKEKLFRKSMTSPNRKLYIISVFNFKNSLFNYNKVIKIRFIFQNKYIERQLKEILDKLNRR